MPRRRNSSKLWIETSIYIEEILEVFMVKCQHFLGGFGGKQAEIHGIIEPGPS
jgi:hypothetical protein